MKSKHLILTPLFSVMAMGTTYGQNNSVYMSEISEIENQIKIPSKKSLKEFRHLDLEVSGGSTGIGVELDFVANPWVTVRAGATYMPKFHKTIHCKAQIGEDEKTTYDEDGQRLPTRFEKMADLLEDFIGTPVDAVVAMDATPSFYNAKFLVDVYPFKNEHWHFTGGFYYGKSHVATAINKGSELPSLMAINLYNRMYDNGGEITDGFSLPPEYLRRLLTYGRAGIHVGNYTHDIMAVDSETGEEYILHAKGDPYMMVPNADNLVFAKAYVNKFRPYFGFGYTSLLGKHQKWGIGFDLGGMFWGGAPKLIDHSGVDLMYDVEDIKGNVGDYVRLARHLKAFPVLELRIKRRLF